MKQAVTTVTKRPLRSVYRIIEPIWLLQRQQLTAHDFIECTFPAVLLTAVTLGICIQWKSAVLTTKNGSGIFNQILFCKHLQENIVNRCRSCITVVCELAHFHLIDATYHWKCASVKCTNWLGFVTVHIFLRRCTTHTFLQLCYQQWGSASCRPSVSHSFLLSLSSSG